MEERNMRTGKVAKLLDLDPKTIANWIEMPEFREFFTAQARGEGRTQRDITEGDLLVLNTIRTLRVQGNNSWHSIAENLRTGFRDEKLEAAAAYVDTGMTPIAQYTRMAETVADRNNLERQLQTALEHMAGLSDRIAAMTAAHAAEKERLLREIAELRESIGFLKGQLAAGDK